MGTLPSPSTEVKSLQQEPVNSRELIGGEGELNSCRKKWGAPWACGWRWMQLYLPFQSRYQRKEISNLKDGICFTLFFSGFGFCVLITAQSHLLLPYSTFQGQKLSRSRMCREIGRRKWHRSWRLPVQQRLRGCWKKQDARRAHPRDNTIFLGNGKACFRFAAIQKATKLTETRTGSRHCCSKDRVEGLSYPCISALL